MVRTDVAARVGTVPDVRTDEATWSTPQIIDQYRMASPVVRRLQEILAGEPNREFTAQELAPLLGKTRAQLAGAVGAYSGYLYRRWGRYVWPFDVRRDQSRQQTYYSMSAETAETIRHAAKEFSDS
jgi:AraC-like DNA-binding protein